jgi:hypothetical protein
MLLSQYFFKKIFHLEFFLVELYFNQSFRLFLDSLSSSGYIDSNPLFLFMFEIHSFKLIYY